MNLHRFNDLPLSPRILKAVEELGFTDLFPIRLDYRQDFFSCTRSPFLLGRFVHPRNHFQNRVNQQQYTK